MTGHLDLTPAAERLAAIVAAVPDAALTKPTPCPAYSVGDLLDHIGGLAIAFTRAAKKDVGAAGAPAPGDASRLGDDWRARIVADLGALGAAWTDASAWEGMTRAGGIDMPGEIAGVVAADELVVHGWDLARATGQPFAVDDATADATLGFYAMFGEDDRGDAFGPPVDVAESASPLERIVAASGRDPGWTAPA